MGINAEGLGRDHWNEMLAYPRKPIAHWHSLVEVKKSFKEVGEAALGLGMLAAWQRAGEWPAAASRPPSWVLGARASPSVAGREERGEDHGKLPDRGPPM